MVRSDSNKLTRSLKKFCWELWSLPPRVFFVNPPPEGGGASSGMFCDRDLEHASVETAQCEDYE